MGKAHSRALRALRELDPPLAPQLVSICGPRPRRRVRGGRALRLGRGRRGLARAGRRRPRPALRQRRPERAARRADDRRGARPASTCSARSRSALDAAESYAMWRGGRGRGRRPPVRLQLPLRAGDPPRARAGRGGRARRARALPRALPPVVGLGRADRRLALRPRAGRARARSATSARTSSTWRASSPARSRPWRRPCARSSTGHEVDDAFVATIELESGAIGTLEASRLARGRVNQNTFELNGSRRLDRLRPRALRRAARLGRRPVPRRARDRRLVAARPRARLGRHVHARVRAPRCARSPARARSPRTARRSRTATAPPRSATRSCARPRAGRRERIEYR